MASMGWKRLINKYIYFGYTVFTMLTCNELANISVRSSETSNFDRSACETSACSYRLVLVSATCCSAPVCFILTQSLVYQPRRCSVWNAIKLGGISTQ